MLEVFGFFVACIILAVITVGWFSLFRLSFGMTDMSLMEILVFVFLGFVLVYLWMFLFDISPFYLQVNS